VIGQLTPIGETQIEGQGKSRAARAIADALIADIKAGRIAVDEALPSERDLCERFESSRPTVREALVMMQQRGYANLNATRRPRAEKPSFEKIFLSTAGHIRDLVGDAESGAYLEQIRQFIEVGAVRSVARSASAIRLAQIHSALDACYDAIDDFERFKETDLAFHRAIVSVVENPIILTLHDLFVRIMLQRRAPPPAAGPAAPQHDGLRGAPGDLRSDRRPRRRKGGRGHGRAPGAVLSRARAPAQESRPRRAPGRRVTTDPASSEWPGEAMPG
jgi:DNA-binding FadR family transcriptional regulator